MSRDPATDLPAYEHPPLAEVVFGIEFAELAPLHVPHFGLFWLKIRDEYPECQHAAPLGSLPERLVLAEMPLPRVWFIHQSGNYVVQLQRDRLIFNWRRTSKDDAYPRNEEVHKRFDAILQKFEEFLAEESLGEVDVVRCELTYINHLEFGDHCASIAEIGNLVPDVRWRDEARYLPDPSEVYWRALFAMDSDDSDTGGSLSAEVKDAIRRSDGEKIAVLELKAVSGGAPEPDGIGIWFEQARRWIVLGFQDLIDEDVQRDLWQRV